MSRILSRDAVGFGDSFFVADNRRFTDSLPIQVSNLAGSAGNLTGDTNLTNPLTEAGTFSFKLATYGQVNPGEDFTTYTVTLDGDEDSTALLAAINAALGDAGTASVASSKLRITNDIIGGVQSTVELVDISTNALGAELGWENGSGVETTTPAAGTTSGTAKIYGRKASDLPWLVIATYTDASSLAEVKFCNEYKAEVTAIGTQGVIVMDLDCMLQSRSVERTNN